MMYVELIFHKGDREPHFLECTAVEVRAGWLILTNVTGEYTEIDNSGGHTEKIEATQVRYVMACIKELIVLPTKPKTFS